MKSRKIISESSLRRYPLPAFLFSFFFTGLGQIYNGELSKGIIFFIIRVLSILLIPFYSILHDDVVSSEIILIAAGIHIVIWLFAAAEALFSARNKEAFNLKRYNSFFIYFFYALLTTSILILNTAIFLSFFFITRAVTDRMSPSIIKNEFILVNRYATASVDIGDAVLFSSEKGMAFGRIIAKENETVNKKGNDFFINDSALSHGVYTEEEIIKISTVNSEELFSETNGTKRYPVKLAVGETIDDGFEKPIILGNREFFIAFDNRILDDSYRLVNKNDIKGRIEGIIFSVNYYRIFNKFYLTVNDRIE